MKSFYVYLNSDDSNNIFQDNSPNDFTVQLPERLALSGAWKCGLVDYQLPVVPSTLLFLCCDACDESVVGSFKLSVLASLKGKSSRVLNIAYISLKIHDTENLRIYIRTAKGKPVSFRKGTTYCTLHFIRDD